MQPEAALQVDISLALLKFDDPTMSVRSLLTRCSSAIASDRKSSQDSSSLRLRRYGTLRDIIGAQMPLEGTLEIGT